MGLMNSYRATFPPAPQLTEANLPNQSGKVFIVTGASAGIGKELAKILYSHDAKVYVAARSQDKAEKVIEGIKLAHPQSRGTLVFLHLDLGDLTTIKASAQAFLAQESRLDVLWNNAGVMAPPKGSVTTQGYELQMGTNCVAPFLFTKLLTPVLVKSAQTAPAGSVRVVWLGSIASEIASPKHGVDMNNIDYKKDVGVWEKYGASKAGNYYHSTEFAKRHRADGVVSVALNPGNLKTELTRHMASLSSIIMSPMLYTSIHGAYTELFAGLSPDVTMAQSGAWIQPWGRICDIRSELLAGSKSTAEGGTGVAEKFWAWSEVQVKAYV